MQSAEQGEDSGQMSDRTSKTRSIAEAAAVLDLNLEEWKSAGAPPGAVVMAICDLIAAHMRPDETSDG